MRNPLVLGVIFTLISGALARAEAETVNSDHVTIVIAQNGDTDKKVKSPSSKKAHKKSKSKKKKKSAKKANSSVTPTQIHRTALAKNGSATQNITINVVSPMKKAQANASPAPVTKVPQPNPYPFRAYAYAPAPGQRATLANPSAARANGYPEDSPTIDMPVRTSGATLTTDLRTVHEDASASSPWTFKLRSYNSVDLNALEHSPADGGKDGDGEVTDWDRFNITYNFNKDIAMTVMPQFYHTWFGNPDRQQGGVPAGQYSQPYSAYWGDTDIGVTDAKLATLPNKYIIDGHLDYYLPTSEASQTSGQIGEVRVGAGLSKSFGNFDFKWSEELRYYIQQYETSSIVDTTGKPLPNQNYLITSLLDSGYNFTKKFNFTLEGGFYNLTKYGDSYNGYAAEKDDYIILNPDFGYTFNDHFALNLGLWEQYNMNQAPTVEGVPVQQYTPFAFYNGTSTYLQATVKF